MHEIRQILTIKLFTLGGQSVTVNDLVLFPVLLIIGYLLLHWFVRFVTRAMAKNGVSPDIIQIVYRALTIIGLVMLFITALSLLNVPLAAFAFVSGAVAIGVGFGAQNIINNFISGWILMWERPIRINDFIEIGDTKGMVEQINTRSTRIRRVDGVHLLIPNSTLLEQTVVNWTLVDRLTRGSVRVGVAYGSPVELVAKLVIQAAREHPEVLADPPPQVLFEDFGDSALIFDLFFWVNSSGDGNSRTTASAIRFRIDALFRENGIVMAFPQQDIHVDGKIRVIPAESND